MKDLQFSAEQFGSVFDFDAFLQGIIDEQEALLSDRIGASVLVAPALQVHIKRAEKCLCAAELFQLRINRLSGNVDAETAVLIGQLKKAKTDYLEEAERIIPKLISGSVVEGSDSAFGYTASSHFDVIATDALS
jgi:hypothetical protein